MADGSVGVRLDGSQPGITVEHSPTVRAVSFFCGCGGLDLGLLGGFDYLGEVYRRLPTDIVAAYDFDPRSVATYRSNVGDHAHVLDLSKADVTEIPSADLLIGGFPCQEFSYCGPRQGLRSVRGQLYKVMVKYARYHKPKVIVAENVAGLLRANNGEDLNTIVEEFRSAGYRSSIWDMRADDYGVPQMRHRIFLIFVRDDLHGFPATPSKREVRINVRDAISDLLKFPNRKIANQSQYFRAARAGKGHGQGDEKSPADGPAYTVRANSRSRVQFHYSRPRRLTVRECARLQTFPDNFIFKYDATSNMSQIGNAVPPVLAFCVMEQVVNFLRAI
ncbi:DNA cytosine methyltransferase [Xanthomonas campestris]|uniref:DNA cytosine methyltransferase n=1 Tax=Xanthomonas campestris TaxID=339 RepID=UPI003CF75353